MLLGGLFLSGCMWIFNKPPVAEFTWRPSQPEAGKEVTFDATDSYDPEGCQLKYYWNFGDGHTDQGAIVTHTYQDDGKYNVRLIVEDKWGKKDTKTQTITVKNPGPIIDKIQIKGRRIIGEVLTFSVSAYDPAEVEPKYIKSYFWDFGDGSYARGPIVSHVYKCIGCYTVRVTVIDDDETETTRETFLRIAPKDRPPIADFTFKINDGILQTQNKSRDNDLACIDGSRIWKYRITRVFWRLYLNNKLLFSTSRYNFTYELPQTGSYKLVLQVEDDEGNIATKVVEFFYP